MSPTQPEEELPNILFVQLESFFDVDGSGVLHHFQRSRCPNLHETVRRVFLRIFQGSFCRSRNSQYRVRGAYRDESAVFRTGGISL